MTADARLAADQQAEGGVRSSHVVGARAGERLDLFVANACDLSRTQAATLIAGGFVLVNGARQKAGFRTAARDQIEVVIPPPPGRDIVPEDVPLSIVYEDDALLVVDKPAGMVVHPAPGHWSGTLVNALVGRGGELASGGGTERPGLVHRLDKETSGLLVVAKTEHAHRTLSAALAARTIRRRYAALCWGHLQMERVGVDAPLARDPRDRQRMAIVSGGKAARTTFVRVARFDSVDLLRAHLHTGRTHQIRVHLNSIGHPVVGDDTYGGGGGRRLAALPPRRHFLHAAWLRLPHPETGALLELRSPLPDDLRHSLLAVAHMPELAEHPDPLAALGFFDADPDDP
jgi:23S rRNA pseudouridine1911/1915/1917 synthase